MEYFKFIFVPNLNSFKSPYFTLFCSCLWKKHQNIKGREIRFLIENYFTKINKFIFSHILGIIHIYCSYLSLEVLFVICLKKSHESFALRLILRLFLLFGILSAVLFSLQFFFLYLNFNCKLTNFPVHYIFSFSACYMTIVFMQIKFCFFFVKGIHRAVFMRYSILYTLELLLTVLQESLDHRMLNTKPKLIQCKPCALPTLLSFQYQHLFTYISSKY